MRSVLGLLFCAALVSGTAWEFGDSRIGYVTWWDHGSQSAWEKNKAITIPEIPCWSIVYVKVEVDNLISTPEVSLDKDSHTINIKYRLWQNSYSSYNIHSKSVPKPDCIP